MSKDVERKFMHGRWYYRYRGNKNWYPCQFKND